MDFFEAQERAQRRTGRLILLFVLAVAGTVLFAYAALVLILAFNQGRGGDDLQPLRLWDPGLFFSTLGVVTLVVGSASLYKWLQMRAGGSVVAELLGGRLLRPDTCDADERRLLNIVEEMSIASGLPVPPVYVMDEEPAINAFAAGLTHGDAVVAVTRGTLKKLNRDELQGVVAHEFSHILQGDMRLNVRLAAVLFGILVLGLLGRGLLEASLRTRTSGSGKDKGNPTVVLSLIGLALLLVGYVGYFFGRLIQSAVSRQREFLADAAAVQFTRNPAGISGALRKIGGYSLDSRLISPGAAQFSHFFFADGIRTWFGGAFATHPSLEERIQAVEPSWDGKFFNPETVVDVHKESFVSAGLAPSPAPAPRRTSPPPSRGRPEAVLAHTGQLTQDGLDQAQRLLGELDPVLRAAAQNPMEAQALLAGLLENHTPIGTATQDQEPWRQRQRELQPRLCKTPRSLQLPLAQLATQGLRHLPVEEQQRFMQVLRREIARDACTTPFEFALEIMVERTLRQARKASQTTDFHSFQALIHEISTVLSALAWTGTGEPEQALKAFTAGADQLLLIRNQLGLLEESACTTENLSRSLDKLGRASLPIRKRSLVAAAAVINADATLSPEEMDLLRAVSAALDCPMAV